MTLRELSWMVDAVLRQRWEETAWIMSAIYNAQPGRKSPVRPRQCNPWRGLFPADEAIDWDGFFGLDDDDREEQD